MHKNGKKSGTLKEENPSCENKLPRVHYEMARLTP
jgi:hypothetical protein